MRVGVACLVRSPFQQCQQGTHCIYLFIERVVGRRKKILKINLNIKILINEYFIRLLISKIPVSQFRVFGLAEEQSCC